MTELRITVGLLRGADDPGEPAPPPRLDQLDDLAATARAAGIEVALRDRRTGRRLPATVELAGFRIAQEAVTNLVRHSRATSATIDVDDRDGVLRIDVSDDGIGPPSSGDRGFGLTGMAERANAVGGRLEIGRTESGGFRVSAALTAAST